MDIKTLRKLGIECWPDNDGGLWYVDPETNLTKAVIE